MHEDLSRVDRSATPWIIVATHVPMYCSSIGQYAHSRATSPPPYEGCLTDGIAVGDRMRKDLEPLLMAYGVDLFMYGHAHAYESTYPIFNGTATQQSLLEPTAPVHVMSGAAGPPGDPDEFSLPASFTRRYVVGVPLRAVGILFQNDISPYIVHIPRYL